MIFEDILTVKCSDYIEKEKAKKRWNTIAKPLKSLGLIEELIIDLCGIYGADNIPEFKPALVVMCGDHGVVSEGVTQAGSEITAVVAENFEKFETSAAVMAKGTGVDLFPIDVGIANDGYCNKELIPFKIADRKVSKGTKNLVKEDAMTKEQCMSALRCGIDIIGKLKEQGYNIFLAGEMGIGNTTASSALASYFLNISADNATGRGAGLCSQGLERKINSVKEGVKRFEMEEYKSPFNALKSLGGYDIAAMAGLFLGGAIHNVPVVIDGFVSSVAALTAVEICPQVRDYIFASHLSNEPCAKAVLEKLNLKAIIYAQMCLGEGTGALTLLPLLKMGADVYKKMSTFEEIKIESYKELS